MNKYSIHIVESVAGRISCATSLDFFHFQVFIKVEDFGSLSSSIFSYLISFSFILIFIFIYLFLWLHSVFIAACRFFQLHHANSKLCIMGSSSPPRHRTQVPCIGSSVSQPLDHQGSPYSHFLILILQEHICQIIGCVSQIPEGQFILLPSFSWHFSDWKMFIAIPPRSLIHLPLP